MSTYEDEHNITPTPAAHTQEERGRQHETLSALIDSFLHRRPDAPLPSRPISETNEEALIAALHQLSESSNENGSNVAQMLMDSLGEHRDSKGVSSEYLDTLERIPLKQIADDSSCPICTNRFKDDKYPLVVRLPCGHGVNHVFDLECVGPWLQMNSTCPMCRTNVLEVEANRRKKIDEEIRKAKEEDSEKEEEDWDIYG
ncbi:hypothetical protein Cantr_06053 [Candida viswanathii]|uniref:RING-type E3 ubiquitin transferase n=1 Tax=Candida viswanathii TaxID=5486 RepID=A0A367XVH5_9ASCO|nr:hypothetical protein Cantr_06053 [Candida viswanathii]